MPDANRVRRVKVSGGLLVDALHIPAGAQVMDARCAAFGCIELLVAHDDFSPVAEGSQIPDASVNITRHQNEGVVSYTSKWSDHA